MSDSNIPDLNQFKKYMYTQCNTPLDFKQWEVKNEQTLKQLYVDFLSEEFPNE